VAKKNSFLTWTLDRDPPYLRRRLYHSQHHQVLRGWPLSDRLLRLNWAASFWSFRKKSSSLPESSLEQWLATLCLQKMMTLLTNQSHGQVMSDDIVSMEQLHDNNWSVSILSTLKTWSPSTSTSRQRPTPQRQAAEAKLSCLISKLSKEEQQLTGTFIGTMTCNSLFAKNDDIV